MHPAATIPEASTLCRSVGLLSLCAMSQRAAPGSLVLVRRFSAIQDSKSRTS